MSSIDSNKEYCITLHLVGYTLKNFTNSVILKFSIRVRELFSEQACEASEGIIFILKIIVIFLSNYSTLTRAEEKRHKRTDRNSSRLNYCAEVW